MTILDDIKTEGEILLKAGEDFFAAGIKAVIAGGNTLLIDAAKNAVAAAEAAGGSPLAKFTAAVAAVEQTLVSEGTQVVLSAINLAVEAAVQDMKTAQASTAASTPPAS